MVIVIAVVAILTAVLIPTFASIIDKANMSADQVAVKNMNTILTTEDNPENDRKKVLEILSEAGFNTEHLIPTSANHKFYWNSTYNMVLLVNCKDENNKIVVFPLGVEEVSKDFYEFEYLSYDLSHILPVAEIEIIKDLQIDDETILDTAVTFFATEERATEEYANWIADFTISFNKDFSLAENEPTSEEIVLLLAGQYDAYSENWLIINPTWVSVYNIEANN